MTFRRSSTFVLTAREEQDFTLMLKGWSARQIANAEGLRCQTVKNYVTTIYDKLGVADRQELLDEWGHLAEPTASTPEGP